MIKKCTSLVMLAFLALFITVSAEPLEPPTPPIQPPTFEVTATFDIYELTQRMDETLALIKQLLEGQAERDERFEEQAEWWAEEIANFLYNQKEIYLRNELMYMWQIGLAAFNAALLLAMIFAIVFRR